MNRHDDTRDQDHGWVDPAETGLLKQTLGAMAGGVDATSPTGPVAAMTAMSRRVRRRRTAKLSGIGGGALALVGVLVLGAAQLAPPTRSEVLPGASSPAASPSSSAEAEPSAAPGFRLREGYQPDQLAGTNLACGAQFEDVELSDDMLLEATAILLTRATSSAGQWSYAESVPVRPIDDRGRVLSGDDLNWPTLVWIDDDGTVVDIGSWEPYPFNNREGAPTTDAYDDRTSSCAAEGADPTLPDGEYEVAAMALQNPTGALVAGDPMKVTVQDGARLINLRGMQALNPFEVPDDPDSTIVQDGGVNSVVLDRTGEWERWVSYQVDSGEDVLPDDPYVVEARCSGTEAGASIGYEVLGDWSGADQSGRVVCDGEPHVVGDWITDGLPLSVSGGTRVELSDAPENVALAYLRLVPASTTEN